MYILCFFEENNKKVLFLFAQTKYLYYLCVRKQNIKVMTLTHDDYRKIANEVLHKENCGYSEFEVIKDNEVMCIGFTYEVDGYTEEETNGYVVTGVSFSAEVVFCANDDEEDTEHNFDEAEVYKLIA